ncbi:hypothetical protein ACLESO_50480, partial [Pyxidicoccus sp. 3LG]
MKTTRHLRFRPWVRAAVLGLGLATGCTHTAPARQGASAQDTRGKARAVLEDHPPEKAVELLRAMQLQAPDDLDVARALTEAHV